MLGAVAVDSDAHTFETRRYRNAFATAVMNWSQNDAKPEKDKREQSVGRFPTRNAGGKRTYIANRRTRRVATAINRCTSCRQKLNYLPWGWTPSDYGMLRDMLSANHHKGVKRTDRHMITMNTKTERSLPSVAPTPCRRSKAYRR